MIELRWVQISDTNTQLEYRVLTPAVDASGALCPGGEWSGWKNIPTITAADASYEDLRASGGIFPEAYNT